jgi:hypothetical protein
MIFLLELMNWFDLLSDARAAGKRVVYGGGRELTADQKNYRLCGRASMFLPTDTTCTCA